MTDSSELKIEKGVPIPSRRRGSAGQSVFSTMEIGDSVLVSATDCARAHALYARFQRPPHNKRFTARVVDGGVRVWRTE